MPKTFALFILSFLLAIPAFASQSNAEREAEAKQAESEDEAARKKNPEALYEEYSGKLTLFTKEQKEDYADSGAIGTLQTEKTTYLVKLMNAKTIDDLKLYDGTNCTVQGKIRNNGKYIVVQKVVLSGAEYIYKRRRGGM